MIRRIIHIVFACLILHSTPSFAAKGKILDIQTLESKQGIKAWLVHDTTVPVISISFSFEGGLAYDPADKPGVGKLVSILLDEGAGDMTGLAFQAEATDNAIYIGFTPGRDAFYGSLRTLSTNKDLAFKLLNLALTQPRFEAEAVTRMKNANISEIQRNLGDPSWLMARTYNGTVFKGHSYAAPGHGTLESMAAITQDDLFAFIKKQFARDVLKVAIAGDITKEEAAAALDRIFGTLPAKAAAVKTGAPPIEEAGKNILFPLDTPQTYIMAAHPAIRRTDPDWHAAVIVNYVLGGGGFDSRLMTEIREKRGLTYGVYSSISNMKHISLIQSRLSASNEKAEEALRLLKEQWQQMATEGPSAKELKEAQAYLTGSLLLDLSSTKEISDTLNSLQRDNLSASYINRRNDLINAVTLPDVQRVAARLLKADQLTTIMVGKPQGIKIDTMLEQPPGMSSTTLLNTDKP